MKVAVPVEKLESYITSINKINKKAVKFGCKEIEYTVGEIFIESIEVDEYKHSREVYNVELIIPELIKINGWDIIGIINHTEIKLITTFGDDNKNIHDKYENFDSKICNHCDTKRKRNYQFILRNDNKEIVVGGSCVKNYIGINPKSFFQFKVLIEEFSKLTYKANYEISYGVENVIEVAIKEIEKNGYKKSHSFDKSTAQDVMTIINKNEEIKIDKATEIIEWIKSSELENDYMLNLKRVINNGRAFSRNIGLLVSSVVSFKGHLGKLLRDKQKSLSNYVGEIGDKIEADVTVKSISGFDTDWGYTQIFNMIDSNGNALIWFTSSYPDLNEGDIIRIKGTIKKHEEYNGLKQTILLRVKEI